MKYSYQNKFIQGLGIEETEVIRNHLLRGDKSQISKEYKLFQTLLSDRGKEFSELELHQSTGSKGNAFKTLRTRLIDTATEALIHNSYIRNDSLFDENDRVIFKVRKKFLVCKILRPISKKANIEFITEELRQIILLAKEYEIYDVLIEALIAKKYFNAIRSSHTAFYKLNKEIGYYKKCIDALYFATDCFYHIMMNNDLSKLFSKRELSIFIASSIKKIEADFKIFKSKQINYYLHILKCAHAENHKDYVSAMRYCKNALKIINGSKTLYKKERVALTYLNLSQYQIFLYDYSTAKNNISNAIRLYPPNSFNYFITKEQEFLVEFYDSNFNKSEAIVNELLDHPTIDVGDFRKSKFKFYHACTLFQKKQYKEVLQLLRTPLEIEKDKGRWNIAVKILSIMTYIELKQFAKASSSLESLRKYVERNKKFKEIKKRDLLIVKLLREIEKNEFEYDPSDKNALKILQQLSDKKGPLAWEHYTPEMIPFHEWIKKRE